MEKKDVKPGHNDDWGTDTLKTPGMIGLSKLERMLPDAINQEGGDEWEVDLNQRRDWKPCPKDEEVVEVKKKEEKEEPNTK